MQTKLNSLDLNGYKTFAKATNLAFPAKITAIVGPNGSGKSNVADAIRWVLGEQSFSTLRAKRTEDMIYAGSESRARAGMASVSISFNNENNWLPIDYAEVVLTRRAYRDGQNEYLINNQRVRLKDFHELLAKTGLSDRTYTIIGQGLVDLALSIKPDERRKLFEEAAGIGLYQSRKEEALKRLETTQRNLERVLDILGEIKPRLRSLERQAMKVGEYKTVQSNLQRNLRDWYGFHWLKSQKEIDDNRNQLNIAQADALKSQSVLEETRQSIAKARTEINDKRFLLNTIHETLRSFYDESQAKHQEMAILEERKHALSDSQAQIEQEIMRLEEVIKAAETELEFGKIELAKSQQALTELKHKRESLLAELAKARLARQQVDQKRSESQSALIEMEKELVVLRAKQTENAERVEEINKSIGILSEKKNQLVLEAEKLEKAKTEAIKKVTDLETDLEANNHRKAKLTEAQNETRHALEVNNQQINRLNIDKNKLTSRLDLLVQGQASLAGFSEGARALLNLSRQKGQADRFKDLASKLDVPERYEKAIAAALGEAVDVLVIKGKRIDEDFIESFERQLSERVAVIAAEQDGELHRSKEISNGNVFGFASDLVKVSDDLRPAVEKLIGHFIVVDDLRTALKLKESRKADSFVTINGEILLTNGLILMGKAKGTSKIAYSRTVKELEEAISEVDNELAKTREVTEKSQEVLEKLNRQYNELLHTSRDIETKLSEARRALNIASLSSDKARTQIATLENQKSEQSRLLEKLKNFNNELSEKTRTLQVEFGEKQNADADIRKQQASFNLTELERSAQELDSDLKLINQTLDHQQATYELVEKRQKENNDRLSEFLKRKNNQASLLQSIDEQIKHNSESLQLIEAKIIETQSTNLTPESESLRELERQSQHFAELEDQHQKTLSIKERQVTHYQLELARQQEKMQSLRSRIEDDFGLIELEYRNEYGSSKSTPLPFPDLVIESLPETLVLPDGIDEDIREQKAQIRRIGIVNLEAEHEYLEVKERHQNLTAQIEDLNAAIMDINRIVKELDEIMHREFLETFKAVSVEFTRMFTRLFNGGSARLILSDENSPIEGGIEIEARLPGRREQGLVLLSGGERSLTAVALIFALLKISPTPICVLDEVDAMLDESNVGRFIDLLKDLSTETQFLLITHNRNTVSAADVIYGVTMGKDSASQIISLRLDEVNDEYIQ